ncbi:E3 ubiquitin-protein like [Actinidia chinensis var. chinensis]|uniref:HECT-type E3 ubiquitin transferase n=1 Tax=Actinidia chinensis var. chinensis TaxID=1590841 RepID=A0A2R6R814_ACTCC|nr:E3 ubiquitin-protein like [Actinidia chinensis var. chinensis]
MGNRGQKRVGTIDELSVDKRACSSLEVRPSSSNSSVQTPMNPSNSTVEAHDGDMETSSSYSGSTRSEGEVEKDSAYGSSDSDGEPRHHSLREYQRQRSSGDYGKFTRVLSSLGQEVDESGTLAALTELCELLSFSTDSSLSSLMADSLSPILVKLARHESNPDIMLFSIRAITYLCDVHSRSAGFLVRHDAVPALCQRLMAIEYLDVAEQCLQALEKISREQPLVCLQSGAIMAVLTYIDFFSTSVQRVALSTVANVCKKLPSECPSPFMEAVPTLCNLLQYEDRQLVETVATCLIKIVERVHLSSDMLDELCKHGLIHQTTSLIDLNGRTTLSQPVYTGLIGLLVKLASGSIVAVRTLFELNISSILKDILSTPDLSHGLVSPNMVDGHCNQVYEVLKLLNELFPAIARDLNVPLNSEKEDFLVNQPDFLQKFGMDLLPILIQVVNSGANLYVCYGSLSVINKFVHFSKSEMLIELLKDTNISSFLAGVFTRKDEHVLILALQIADTVLQKLSDIFLNSFVKEGVFFAIDALLMPEKCSQSMFPLFNGIQLSNDSSQKSDARNILRCFCYTFDTGQSLSASETGTCKLEKDSVHTLANKIRANYIAAELLNPDKGLTDILQKLRTLAAALTDLVNASTTRDTCMQPEEEFHSMLHQIMAQVNGGDPISTFEFIESGIVKALVNYLSNAHFLRENTELTDGFSKRKNIEKRFEVFGRLFLSSLDAPLEDFCLSVVTRKLQTALSSVENFPVILSQSYRQRNSYATVPYGRCMSHPCLRVQFMRGDGETALCDFSKDVLTVDPFSSLDSIEGYLWPKVGKNRVEHVKSAATQVPGGLESLPSELPSDVNSPGGKSPDLMDSDSVPSDMQEMQFSPPQEDKANISHSAPEERDNLRQTASETTGSSNAPADHVQEEETGQRTLSKEDTEMSTRYSEFSGNEDASPALLFYLEGQQLDRALSLYQAILQQQINAGDDIFNSAKLWSQVYRVTYRRAEKPRQSYPQDCQHQAHDSSSSDRSGTYWQYTPFFPGMFASELEKSSPVSDVLFLLKSLVGINRYRFHMMTHERMYAFAKGRIDNLDNLEVMTSAAPDNEFVSSKLTEKLEQQMRDPLAVSVGGMPSWCGQLMASYPFLFAFEVRCKYFRLTAFGQLQAQPHPTAHNGSGSMNGRRQNASGLPPRKKFTVCRNHILESATQMMDLHARQKAILEVEYDEEVGTGLGPTLEFFTLVSHEFQKSGLFMWREDHGLLPWKSLQAEDSQLLVSPCGLFPRPCSSIENTSSDIEFSAVIKRFVLLGQVIAKALQDGRVLDILLSQAFYKLILGKELTVYDIYSFDPGLGRALLEFQAVVERKRYFESICGENSTFKLDSCFRNTTIEDLCLDFTLPGYPDYILTPGHDPKLVNMTTLEEYVSLVVDATINTGICRQVEAFKSGFNQVFPIEHLQVFTEEELERLLCGECEFWTSNELLDHIKFDHGYTASSPPIVNLLEVIREFNREQQRAFLQFVTGAPRLPRGGLASLNPKLTIVRKHCSKWVDADLPSVMTCANYLKLPPYSSKERMKEKLLYAITEGQGSFHLS